MAEDDVRKGCVEDVTSELRPRLTKGMKRRGKAAGSMLSIRNSTSKSLKLEKTENAGGGPHASVQLRQRDSHGMEREEEELQSRCQQACMGFPFFHEE